MTFNSNISSNIAQFQVGNTSTVKKQAGATETTASKSEGTKFKEEKGSAFMDALAMQGAQNLQQLSKKPATEGLVFDPAALTAQIEGGALDSTTLQGLETLGKPGVLQMFGGFSDQIADKPIGEQLALQNGLLKEFQA